MLQWYKSGNIKIHKVKECHSEFEIIRQIDRIAYAICDDNDCNEGLSGNGKKA